jgi:hypothetical protein
MPRELTSNEQWVRFIASLALAAIAALLAGVVLLSGHGG